MNKLLVSLFVVCFLFVRLAHAKNDRNEEREVLSKDASQVLNDIQKARAFLSRHPEESRSVDLEGIVTCEQYWKTGFIIGNEEGLSIPCNMGPHFKSDSPPIQFKDLIRLKGMTVSGKFLVDVSSVEVIGRVDSIPSKPIRYRNGNPSFRKRLLPYRRNSA